jgi:hypothetical protein
MSAPSRTDSQGLPAWFDALSESSKLTIWRLLQRAEELGAEKQREEAIEEPVKLLAGQMTGDETEATHECIPEQP